MGLRWFGFQVRMVSFDMKGIWKAIIPHFQVKIREMTIAGDSLIYKGGIEFPENIQLAFDENSVSLDYAAPLFIAQNDIQYCTH